jgi:hypothetical protein
MPLLLSINTSFITNSSSAVHHFPRELLNDPSIRAFIAAFELDGGVIGSDMWSRDLCTTVAMTPEQKQEVLSKLVTGSEYCSPPSIQTDDDTILIIYGDEHTSVASSLARLMESVAEKLGIKLQGSQEYNLLFGVFVVEAPAPVFPFEHEVAWMQALVDLTVASAAKEHRAVQLDLDHVPLLPG